MACLQIENLTIIVYTNVFFIIKAPSACSHNYARVSVIAVMIIRVYHYGRCLNLVQYNSLSLCITVSAILNAAPI